MQRRYSVLILVTPLLAISLGLFSQGVRLFPVTAIHSQPSQAQQAIDAAQNAINAAYINLVFADNAGSLITDLIGTLNGAITELNQARNAYAAADYATAITLAETAESTAHAVSNEAHLRGVTITAQIQAQIVFIFAVILISILASYFAISRWHQYRKQKQREFLRMEIRLPDDEEEEQS
ncbi:MAG: hypothetical protein ACFE9D_07095 [Promethearchaeota archaeon]